MTNKYGFPSAEADLSPNSQPLETGAPFRTDQLGLLVLR